MPAMPMADSRRADGGRDQRDEQRHQHDDGDGAAGIGRDSSECVAVGEHEDDRQTDQQNIECDFVRRLLALGALDQLDHAIEERSNRATR